MGKGLESSTASWTTNDKKHIGKNGYKMEDKTVEKRLRKNRMGGA